MEIVKVFYEALLVYFTLQLIWVQMTFEIVHLNEKIQVFINL